MGVTNLDILLDDPGKIYFGGQKIIGEIRIVMDSPQKVRRTVYGSTRIKIPNIFVFPNISLSFQA